MGTWYNGDGLFVKLGLSEAVVGKAGEFGDTYGMQHIVEVVIPDMTALVATDGGLILDDNVMIPKGARIDQVTIEAETACTGAGAVLNVGLIRSDRTTELDYNGLIAGQILTTLDAAGETTDTRINSTYVGALVGTTLAYNGLLVADYDTAAFTAGKVRVRVHFYFP